MKQRFLVAIVTALVFCAGYFAGSYTERHRPLPEPPVQFLGEFAPAKDPAGTPPPPAVKPISRPVDRAQILAQLKSLLPQLQVFEQKSEEIDAQFEHDLDLTLTPAQQTKHAAEMATESRRRHDHLVRDESRPVTDDYLTYLIREQPSRTISNYVVIPLPLDMQTKRYELDPDQREKVRTLLHQRRDRFLTLVDSSPPPSVVLSRLAPLMAQLDPTTPSAAAAVASGK
jgi:hypothetical protein